MRISSSFTTPRMFGTRNRGSLLYDQSFNQDHFLITFTFLCPQENLVSHFLYSRSPLIGLPRGLQIRSDFCMPWLFGGRINGVSLYLVKRNQWRNVYTRLSRLCTISKLFVKLPVPAFLNSVHLFEF